MTFTRCRHYILDLCSCNMSAFAAFCASAAEKGASLAMGYASSAQSHISLLTEVVQNIDEAVEQWLEASSAMGLAAATQVVDAAVTLRCCGGITPDDEGAEVEVEERVVEGARWESNNL